MCSETVMSGGSICNAAEATVVCQLLHQLLQAGVAPKDIGVICL